MTDLAVNVRPGTPPQWLVDRIAGAELAAYPDQHEALAAVAARHHRDPAEVLLTAGAAEAFVLIARGLATSQAAVVHPQFTEPEVALRIAGWPVHRVVLDYPFVLDPSLVPEDADLVVIGNPTNPTSVLHPADVVRSLRRPGRVVVVDEAFADCVAGETASLAADPDLRGVIVVRSLTKTWGLAGLRVGYLLADRETVAQLRGVQHAWPVSTPALVACVATCEPAARAEAHEWAEELAGVRAEFASALAELAGVRVVPHSSASFLLLDIGRNGIRERLHQHGFAVRRGESFPGLGEQWIRVAVRDRALNRRFVSALAEEIQ
jgi:histidinol-phosphate aminotransferase